LGVEVICVLRGKERKLIRLQKASKNMVTDREQTKAKNIEERHRTPHPYEKCELAWAGWIAASHIECSANAAKVRQPGQHKAARSSFRAEPST